MMRLGIATLAATLAVAACATPTETGDSATSVSSGVRLADVAVPAPAEVKDAAYGEVKTQTGVIAGATYRIDLPPNWNKGVVVMNHGYSPEPRAPQSGAPGARITMFTDRGFAVVQSSYSRGGWAIEQAMTDNKNLLKYFESKNGKAGPIIATGGAMGASVTTASVEMFPDIYDAGLVTCCSGLESRLENMNWNFELLSLFEYYFPGVMPPVVGPLNGYEYSIGNTTPTAKKVQAALDANPEKAEIFRRAWGRKKEDVAGTVAFHTYLIHEAQERSGGNPFSNETTIYNVDDDIVKVNEGVKRQAAEPGKNAYLKKWYTATGNLKKKLFIMSPVYDPIVPADTTEAYVSIARRAGHADKLVFQIFDHYGHGSVTTPEVAAAFDDLLAWMKGGPQPKSGKGVNREDAPRAPRPARSPAAAQ